MNQFWMLPRRVSFLALTLGLLAVLGCGSSREIIVVGENTNQDGNASLVRIYELSGVTNFQAARLEEFWRNDEQVLGGELISKQQLRLYPNETPTTLELELDEKAQYLGVAADLRQPAQDQWRASYSVQEVKGKSVAVMIGSNRLVVEIRE